MRLFSASEFSETVVHLTMYKCFNTCITTLLDNCTLAFREESCPFHSKVVLAHSPCSPSIKMEIQNQTQLLKA